MIPVDAYWMTVAGSTREPGQNEDRAGFHRRRNASFDHLFVGIADGVSETIYAGRWADSLVIDEEWMRLFQPARYPLDETLWRWHAGAISRFEPPTGGSMLWYLKAKAQRGTAATFLGARLRRRRAEGASVDVDIVSIGDCGAFLVREGRVQALFPALTADEYGRVPESVHSLRGVGADQLARPSMTWRLRRGEHLILATDAVAQWLSVDSDEIQASRVVALLGCRDDDALAALVREQRTRGYLRDDDATVVVVTRRG